MRFVALLSVVSAAGFASASFDLILVSDSSKKVIHRYDGDSGTYLGSFGAGFIGTAFGMALDQPNNTVVVTTTFGTSAFDYNTGVHLWTNTNFSATFDMAFSGSTLARSNAGTSTVAFATLNGSPQFATSQTNYSGPTGLWTGIGVDSSGRYLATNSTTGQVSRWTSGSTAAPTATSAVVNIDGGLSARGSLCLGLTATGSMVAIDTNTMAAVNGGVPSQGAFTSAVDTAFGHGNVAWGLGTAGGVQILQSYNKSNSSNTYSAAGRYSLTQVGAAQGMVVVVAPEPGSLAALGLGLVVLLRRRK